jgi:hypothetical protein
LTRLFTDYRRIVGDAHPDTLATYGDLANCWGLDGGPAYAVDPLTRLFDAQHRILGPTDPDTMCTRYNLAHWRGEGGDPAGATDALEVLVLHLVEMCGLDIDHPSVLMVQGAQAHWLGLAGQRNRAIGILQRLLDDQLRVLGSDHLDVLTTRAALADWWGRSGDRVGAADDLQRLLADQLRVLGPDDPRIEQTRSDLTHWRDGGPRVLHIWTDENLTHEPLKSHLRRPWEPQPLIGYQARASWAAAILAARSEAGSPSFPVDSAWSNSVH